MFRHLAGLSADQNPFLDEKDAYTQLPSKRWSASTTASSAPSLPEISKAVPFLTTRHTDMSSPRNSIQYSNIPVPPSHTPRHSQLYPATGHLYPASGPVPYDALEKLSTERNTKKTTTEKTTEKGTAEKVTRDDSDKASTKSRTEKKSWGNLSAPALPKRKESGATIVMEDGKPKLELATGGAREWSFNFGEDDAKTAGHAP